MPSNKDITPYNEREERHGYWEVYWSDDQLWFKGNYVNNKGTGLWIINNEEYFYAN